MRPYRVKVTVRNNLLLSAIEAAGYKSQSEFARSAELSPTEVNNLVAMRHAPITLDGEFSHEAKAIMEALGACPSDLWTDEQLTLRLKRNTGERSVESDVVAAMLEQHNENMLLPNPESLMMELDKHNVVAAALDSLTEREKKVLQMHNGIDCNENSLEDIAKVLNVTRERVRQIEAKAMRKLRRLNGKTDFAASI